MTRLAALIVCIALQGCTALVIGGAAAGGYVVGKDERPVGTIIDDGTITAAVKTRLIRSKYVQAGQVDVDTREGVVTLNGTVGSYIAKEQAEVLAMNTSGVRTVENRLEVEPVTGE
ncbi:MAG: BON domain-containing protein [Gammaproteobacteria bacterium]|nr:BON domain-containing protein [Gammaproteobacteria bacterium]NNM20335.1 BON domain-containing protein [Gammaproteobacteria bacterium]